MDNNLFLRFQQKIRSRSKLGVRYYLLILKKSIKREKLEHQIWLRQIKKIHGNTV